MPERRRGHLQGPWGSARTPPRAGVSIGNPPAPSRLHRPPMAPEDAAGGRGPRQDASGGRADGRVSGAAGPKTGQMSAPTARPSPRQKTSRTRRRPPSRQSAASRLNHLAQGHEVSLRRGSSIEALSDATHHPLRRHQKGEATGARHWRAHVATKLRTWKTHTFCSFAEKIVAAQTRASAGLVEEVAAPLRRTRQQKGGAPQSEDAAAFFLFFVACTHTTHTHTFVPPVCGAQEGAREHSSPQRSQTSESSRRQST